MQRGFTLIELLVVIAIIGILSAVVLGSVSAARLKGQEAAVRQEAAQLRSLMEQERSNSDSYAPIKSGGAWKAVGAQCAVGTFSGQYASQASLVCTKLVAATGNTCGNNCVYFQTVGPSNVATKYSIMAYLPYTSLQLGSARYLCIGSSGNQSISDGAAWTEDGCYQNP
jgi:prepilin-type N-terminal cleavage/methylation domain-containing protein